MKWFASNFLGLKEFRDEGWRLCSTLWGHEFVVAHREKEVPAFGGLSYERLCFSISF
jgi:hypothetical protein